MTAHVLFSKYYIFVASGVLFFYQGDSAKKKRSSLLLQIFSPLSSTNLNMHHQPATSPISITKVNTHQNQNVKLVKIWHQVLLTLESFSGGMMKTTIFILLVHS